jgi:hypothetical protein
LASLEYERRSGGQLGLGLVAVVDYFDVATENATWIEVQQRPLISYGYALLGLRIGALFVQRTSYVALDNFLYM